MIRNTTPSCFSNHLGAWAIEQKYLSEALAHIRSGVIKPKAITSDSLFQESRAMIQKIGSVGVVSIVGPMMKGVSKYGGASSVAARMALRTLAEDDQVSQILLRIESPGGHVAGTAELAADVSEIDATCKPVHAYAEDMCCSAAYWVACQARTVTANSMALVGSIGTIFVLEDSSKAAAAEGVDVKVFATGPHKGAGTPGTPITEEQAKQIQALVDQMSVPFFAAVKKSRELSASEMAAATTGAYWAASTAKDMGLIDAMKPFEDVVSALAANRSPTARRSRASAALSIEKARG